MKRRGFLSALGGTALTAGYTTIETGKAKKQPNLLLIMSDDMSWSDIGCYGSKNAKTPNIDKLAKSGMRFDNCYNAISMCTPTRCMLYTGLYPVRNGSYRNHTFCKPDVKSICNYMLDLGYRVGLTGKQHFAPRDCFPFEIIPGFEKGCVKPTDNYTVNGIKEFMTRNREQPFCLVTAGVSPHGPWTVGDTSAYPPEKLKLPAHMADTQKTRERYSSYCAEVTYFDKQLGDVVKVIDNNGLKNDTLVLFLSEQGAQFPGSKWTLYNQGIKAGAVARWPGKIKPGSVSDALVEYVDVLPTFIDAAGGRHDPNLDGLSFLDVLKGKKKEHKEYAFGIHNNCPEGPPYPIRSVATKQFKYIWNLTPDKPYEEKHLTVRDNYDYWKSWKKKAKTDKRTARLVKRFIHRPKEELYDLKKDPWEMNNIAEKPQYKKVKEELRGELLAWMESQGDKGTAIDVMPPPKKKRKKRKKKN